MNINKFPVTSPMVDPVTSSMEDPDYDNTPTYTPAEPVVIPSLEDIYQQKPSDCLIKQCNNSVYPTNPTPLLVQHTNELNGPHKPKLGWIEEKNDLNYPGYPGKPTERFGLQPDVINYPRPEGSEDICYPVKLTNDQIQPAVELNYPTKPKVSFVELSDNINSPRKASIGFSEPPNDTNSPRKASTGFSVQPNDTNSPRKASIGLSGQPNDTNSPWKAPFCFSEQPEDTNYHGNPSVGLVEQPNGIHSQRKPSIGFVEQPNNAPFHRKPTVSFTDQPNEITVNRKLSAGFSEQSDDSNYFQKPEVGFSEQYNGLLYPPKSTEDFSVNDSKASYRSNPTHVVVQQTRNIPFPKVPPRENIKNKKSGSGNDPYSTKQSHDFFTQSNDLISQRKSSGINGRTHGRVTIHVDEDSRHEKRSSCSKCGNCCKKTFAFLVSHIGLCSLVVGYSIAGGFIFRELESPFEARERSNVALTRLTRVEELWNITEKYNVLCRENWTVAAERVLLNFQMEVFRATKEKGWDGKDGDSNLQWSFAGALLYSVTVITTIGYGHIAPKTPYGRLVTIFYALIGIPLTLLCLANIGRMFSDCFRFTYKYTCRCLKWTFLPSKPVFKRRAERKRNSSTRKRAKRQMRELERAEELIFSIEDQKQALEEEEEVRVPIFISMGVMALYIFGGAVLFMLWEDDWDYLIGSYFCFITLSTIGFGDFVPGASVDSWANQEKTILCTLYLVFGLSLIAMCFNLMQEEVKLKFRWLATKLNIIDVHKNKR